MEPASLHAFLVEQHEVLVHRCLVEICRKWPEQRGPELSGLLSLILDEITRKLQQAAGVPVQSPLPEHSPAAAAFGRRHRFVGGQIADLAVSIGELSKQVGALGEQHDLAFGAGEYKVYDASIDACVASAVESYWEQARQEERGAFNERLGSLAHELRNALSSARMGFDMIRRGQGGSPARTSDIVDRNLKRLETLVGDSLEAVRTGASPATLISIRLSPLLRAIEASTPRSRDVEIVVSCPEDLEIRADEELLTRALSNLVQNAVKFTQPGGRVAVRASAQDRSVMIEIEDECGGLPPGAGEELFKPFTRLHETSAGPAGHTGLGLGLTIVRSAIERLDGSVSVRDLPAKGCVFVVRLPMTS